MERDGFAQVAECDFFGLTLAGDVDFETLGDVPIALADDASGERAFHDAGSSRGGWWRGTEDLTLNNIILVPTAMQLLGNWNWWFPAWLDRRLPRIDLAE